jgi:acyl carrier protein/carbonic anhydrase/acetyltransferase-like protein (isoleucine patch superfamily)
VEIRSSPVVSHLVTGPGGRIEIGRGARIAHGAAIAAYASVRIGSGAQIGPFVMIMDTDFHEAGKHASRGGTGPISIGDNARLGSRVTVLRGANIGAGAIVAAGSVVSGEIAPGARVSGVPARSQDTSGGVRETLPLSVESVLSVVARTFGLQSAPHGSTNRDEIAAWDSLGSLNLLLALEEAFDLTLSQQDVVEIETIDDVFAAVGRAAAGDGARWSEPDDSVLDASFRASSSLSRT